MNRIQPTLLALMAAGTALLASGCAMPNASNPTVSLRSAHVVGQTADLELSVGNPSEMDVEIEQIDWQLVFGPLPVAEGTWPGPYSLAQGETMELRKTVTFDQPPLDSAADEIELSGTLEISSSEDDPMSLQSGAFVTRAPIDAKEDL